MGTRSPTVARPPTPLHRPLPLVVCGWTRINHTTQPPLQFDDDVLNGHIQQASNDVWNVPTLRPMQLEVVNALLNPRLPNNIIAIHKTGGGKTHIIRVVGVMGYGGWYYINILPLLTLSADVLIKFQNANDDYGDVNVQHLDELYDVNYDKYKQVLHRCDNLPKDTTSIYCLYFYCLSSSFITWCTERYATCRGASNITCYLHWWVSRTLSAWIFVSWWYTCTERFFAKVFQPSTNYDIRFLATTATMPQDYIPILSSLTTISFPPNSIKRGTFDEFEQTEIF